MEKTEKTSHRNTLDGDILRSEINRLKKQVASLRAQLADEKSLIEYRSNMASLVAHEVRGPLSTILTSLFLIEQYSSGSGSQKCAKHFERIRVTIRNLTATLNDFLCFDKLEKKKMEVNIGEFDLEKFTMELMEELSKTLRPGQYISLSYTGDRFIKQDKQIITYSLLNLVSNASKYSENGKRIEVVIRNNPDKALIEVRDEGIGIPDDEKKNIFSDFYRAKNTIGISGTGLGLNIVQRYTTLINGKIDFESKVGAGSTFRMEFPSVLVPDPVDNRKSL